jgi:hypothetical protein
VYASDSASRNNDSSKKQNKTKQKAKNEKKKEIRKKNPLLTWKQEQNKKNDFKNHSIQNKA